MLLFCSLSCSLCSEPVAPHMLFFSNSHFVLDNNIFLRWDRYVFGCLNFCGCRTDLSLFWFNRYTSRRGRDTRCWNSGIRCYIFWGTKKTSIWRRRVVSRFYDINNYVLLRLHKGTFLTRDWTSSHRNWSFAWYYSCNAASSKTWRIQVDISLNRL